MKWRLKSCPRCGGDLYRHTYSKYSDIICLQLGSVMEMREGFHQLLISLRRLDKPTIASINGPAVAGGANIALVCNFRNASDRAGIGNGSLRFGFVPDEGGASLLPRIVGLENALELILLHD